MQFSNTTNKNGIIQGIEQITPFGDAGISGNSFELVRFTNLVNNWLHIVTHWIQQVQGQWTYDDQNHGNLPIEVFDFVDEQSNYGLTTNGESDSLAIRRVEIRDATSEEYSDISYMLEKDKPEDEFGEDAGTPTKYYMSGGSIVFNPKPDTAKVDKFRVTYDRNAHIFLSNDTTALPGFDLKFHAILVYGPAMDWAASKGLNDIYNFCFRKLFGSDTRKDKGLKLMLEEFYSSRLPNVIPQISRKKISWK